MLFSYDDWRDVKQSEMDELLAQCSHNQTGSEHSARLQTV